VSINLPKSTPTIAFEMVATPVADGMPRLRQEALKVKSLFEQTGLAGRINTLLLPQIIAEEGDRPVRYIEKIDPLEAQPTFAAELGLASIMTQVTVFTPDAALRGRLERMRSAGVSRVVFVGVPRVFKQSEIVGPYPNQALQMYADVIPSRGVVLIPTRPDEEQRFSDKLAAGANFGLCQLLFSDAIVRFLRRLKETPHLFQSGRSPERIDRFQSGRSPERIDRSQSGRSPERIDRSQSGRSPERIDRPELLLSFGYVPKVEQQTGLISWLIKDGTPGAQADMAEVARLAEMAFSPKKARLVELFRRVISESLELGFPLGLHFEAPYGASVPALETFAEMLQVWDELTRSTPALAQR
jgi:hypothetical protein